MFGKICSLNSNLVLILSGFSFRLLMYIILEHGLVVDFDNSKIVIIKKTCQWSMQWLRLHAFVHTTLITVFMYWESLCRPLIVEFSYQNFYFFRLYAILSIIIIICHTVYITILFFFVTKILGNCLLFYFSISWTPEWGWTFKYPYRFRWPWLVWQQPRDLDRHLEPRPTDQ